MPTFKLGNMWDEFGKPNTLFVFTANSTIKKNNCLVMGRGIAQAVRDRLDGIDAAFGKIIQMQHMPDEFGLLIISFGGHKVGALQVKTHFSEMASLVLIKNAVNKLATWANEHPSITVNLNYPGIGCGRLSENIVCPVLEVLPENVYVWKFE